MNSRWSIASAPLGSFPYRLQSEPNLTSDNAAIYHSLRWDEANLAVERSCAQRRRKRRSYYLYGFKNINIPVSLKINDKILAKAAYDLEFCRVSHPEFYFVRIMKKGEILEVVQGEELPYNMAKDRNLPNKPTLKMNRNQNEKLLILVLESGIWTKVCPRIRARFEIQYEE